MRVTGQEPVAVRGIGAMGHGMATSLLRAGIPTIVWNRTPAATRDLAGLGADVAATAADAAQHATIVVTMVTDTDAVISIARDQGMLQALAPGAIWVQMGTIGVAGIERVAAMVAAQRPDVTLLDTPVAGSSQPAEQGQLTIFASGPEQARPRVAALFDALGQRTIWVGGVGAGSRLKLVNNTLVAFAAEAVATSVALAGRLGLATEQVLEALGAVRWCRPGRRPSWRGSPTASSRPSSRCRWRSRTCAWPSRRPTTTASPCLGAWPMSGSRRWIRARRPGPHRGHARAPAAGRNAMTLKTCSRELCGALLALLAGTAGSIDARATWPGKVFTANMTGNAVLSAIGLASRRRPGCCTQWRALAGLALGLLASAVRPAPEDREARRVG
jgi:3-hydroxyisobutyrate dehydrogenase